MNNNWDTLSLTEKRLAIVRDVIAQIKSKRFIAETQVYCRINTSIDRDESTEQLQTILKTHTCQVCAKGAIFAANILRNNNLLFKDYNSSNINAYNEERLNELWTTTEFDTIETAFETCPINGDNRDLVENYYDYFQLDSYDDWDEWYDSNSEHITELARRAAKFGNEHPNDEERLLAIMNNMLENEGKFIV